MLRRRLILTKKTGFDLNYQDVLNTARTLGYALPSVDQQQKQNAFIINLKAAGIWQKLDLLHVYATNGDQNFATINWKNPANRALLVNSPTFTANQGFAGNGTSSYIDTNFNPAVSGVNYQLNNAGRGIYVRNGGNGAGLDGAFNTGSNLFNRLLGGGSGIQSINTSGANSLSKNLGGVGLRSIYRTTANNVELFADKVQNSVTGASAGVASFNQVVLRNGAGNFSTAQVSMYYMGASLVSEHGTLTDLFLSYLNSL